MKESNSTWDTPPSTTDRRTAVASSFATFLISWPSSDAISFRTAFSMVVAITNSFRLAQSLMRRPTRSSSVISTAFLGWSECIGHAAMGTPIVMLSMQEFHPQWLTNPPVDGWLKISNCGAQSRTTNPLLDTLLSNPSGSFDLLTSPSKTFPLSASLNTQMNFCPLFSNPPMKLKFNHENLKYYTHFDT